MATARTKFDAIAIFYILNQNTNKAVSNTEYRVWALSSKRAFPQ